MPPPQAKTKGRGVPDAEIRVVTLGAQGAKKGTRRCGVCLTYTTHNSRTCPTLEHNKERLEAKKNKKRGRPPGAKNRSTRDDVDRGVNERSIRPANSRNLKAKHHYIDIDSCDEEGDDI